MRNNYPSMCEVTPDIINNIRVNGVTRKNLAARFCIWLTLKTTNYMCRIGMPENNPQTLRELSVLENVHRQLKEGKEVPAREVNRLILLIGLSQIY